MTHQMVDIHTDQNLDNGMDLAKDRKQKRGNEIKPPAETVKDGLDCGLKMRETHYSDEKVSCPTCNTLFTKNRPWQQFCSTPCRRKHHRTETRDAILTGMVATAQALHYTKDEFISRINTMWE